MSRFLRGSLRQEKRAKGKVWVLRYLTDRAGDGKRVEHKSVVGSVRDFPSKAAAWAEIDRQHLHEQMNKPGSRGPITFGSTRPCAPGSPAPAAASRFMVPITLISCSVRPVDLRRVDDRGACAAIVSTWVARTMRAGSSTTSRPGRTRCARAACADRGCRRRRRPRRRVVARAAARRGCPRTSPSPVTRTRIGR